MEFIFPFTKSILVIFSFISIIEYTKSACKKAGFHTLKQQYYWTLPATFVYSLLIFLILYLFDKNSFNELIYLFTVKSFLNLLIIVCYTILTIFSLYLGKFYFIYVEYDIIDLEFNFLFFIQKFYAPFIEEFLYRGVLISFKVVDSLFYNGIISSILFGLSHLRHLFDDYSDVTNSKEQIYFQVCFTTLFGIICSCFLSVTGSIYSCIIAHILCNILGLPRIFKIETKENQRGKIIYLIGIIMFITILLVGFIMRLYHIVI